jgi:Na+-translocating ferredoxin:NAD+ oxidoreductase subunit C
MKVLSFLRGETFARGIHPPQHKYTAHLPIKRLPFPDRLVVPLSQHIGRAAKPLVRVGQEVARGEPIAEADGWLSVPHHAPATGVVEAIELRPSSRGPWVPSIVIRVFQGSTQEVMWGQPRMTS